ncbi:hypothetical protein FO519_010095 [Halicephalobus sp. NKZ332]|nr:hypothetical protein FO519_010095 [Halicephalobus sp. NKZ332]
MTLKMSFSVLPEIEIEEKLCGFDFTLKWLLDSLMKNDKLFKKFSEAKTLKRLETKDVSEGKGMFSTVLKVELFFVNEKKEDEEVYTTILKIPGVESFKAIMEEGKDVEELKFGGNSLTPAIIQMHDIECDFYNLVAPLIPDFVPRVYYAQRWIKDIHQGCLHMEDLSPRGKNMYYFNTLTVPQFKNVIDALAFFHSRLMNLEESEWRGKFVPPRNVFSHVIGFVQEMSPKFLDITKSGKKELTELYFNEKIQKILNNQEFIDFAFFESHLKIGLPTLLVHADLWASNIMFKIDSEGNFTDELVALLDWQCLREGNWMLDFVKLTTCSLDGDIRREMEETIFDFYISKLRTYLQRDPGFTAIQMKKSYEFYFLAHLGYATTMPGAIFGAIKATNAPKDTVTTNGSSATSESRLDEARIDRCTLRAIHAYEDALILLDSGEYDEWL